MLFASAEPLTESVLAERLPEDAERSGPFAAACRRIRDPRRPLTHAGAGWAFVTAADLAPFLARERRIEKKLSRAAMETLAVIAYHQPVTRGEIEEIRGVQLGQGDTRRVVRARLDRAARTSRDAGPAGDLGHDRRFPAPLRTNDVG